MLSLLATLVWLPESLPEERRIRHRLRDMAAGYRFLLRNRRYCAHALALGAVAGINFSYISGAPQLFIELHGVSPQQFGILFGLNAFGLIGASQLNRRLLRRYPSELLMGIAFGINLMSALLLALAIASGLGGFPAQLVLLFICLCTTGLLYPNVTALALAPFGSMAGSASALLGTIQYTLGATAGACVGMFHNGTGLPMALTMAGCAVAGTVAAVVARKPQPLLRECGAEASP
ncbi:MFS transporter [Trichlorobacter ammonificans]|uniref:Uncharacterized protein n=1 Tax=Trichlorobacter ammonificans TaxID=2916410 RepID=A0ABM9D6B1_9BACT|nr:membrane protein of unknown function [Trichlorobacter ammonificans]